MKAKATTFVADLPTKIQSGDRIKLRDGKRGQYREACKLAGYFDFNEDKIHTVIRKTNDAPGGAVRLWVEGQPFCFNSGDVVLAWSTDDERRRGLGL